MVRTDWRRDGAHARLVLDQPKGNILSRALIAELAQALRASGRARAVKLVTIEGAGDQFSYGASVEEHRAAAIADVLRELHGLIRQLLAVPAPTAAVVRRRCLG